MGRVCAVPGCISGSVKDMKQREADQVRKCSSFQVPKDMPLRKVWSDTLGIELKNTDVVCELHFNYEDLNMNDDFTLINGELIVSVRERITLNRKARPVGIVVEAYEKRKAEEREFRLSKARQYSVKLPQTAREKPKLVYDSASKFSNTTIVSQEPQDVQMQEVHAVDIGDINTKKDCYIDFPKPIDEEAISNELSSINSPLSITDPVFSKSNLLEILKNSHLRQNWAWGEKDEDIFFTLFDLNALEVRCYFQVHSNMKVSIFLSDKQKLVNLTGITEIKSFENLKEILHHLEKQKLCMGTGVTQKSRSETCAITAKSDICKWCSKEKLRQESFKPSIEKKNDDLVRSKNLLKKKFIYCRKKLDEARKRVAELKKEMNNLKENSEKSLLESLLNS